jgi:hypothetical protein
MVAERIAQPRLGRHDTPEEKPKIFPTIDVCDNQGKSGYRMGPKGTQQFRAQRS